MLSYIPYPAWIKPEIIPGLPIRWYGFMYLVAFAVTYLLFMWQLARRNGPPLKPTASEREAVLDMFFWAIIGLLVGGRLFAVTIYDPTGYYFKHPLQIILPFSRVDGRVRLTGIAGHVVPRRGRRGYDRDHQLPEDQEARCPGLGGHAGIRDSPRLHLREAGQFHQRGAVRQDHHRALGNDLSQRRELPGQPAVGEGLCRLRGAARPRRRPGEPSAASLAAVRGVLRGPGPLADPLVHRPQAAAVPGLFRCLLHARLRRDPVLHRVRPPAGQGDWSRAGTAIPSRSCTWTTSCRSSRGSISPRGRS